jgi:hypothetical protein
MILLLWFLDLQEELTASFIKAGGHKAAASA